MSDRMQEYEKEFRCLEDKIVKLEGELALARKEKE